MKFPSLHRHSAIGVDLGSRLVKVAQRVRHGPGWRLSAAASYPRLTPGAAPDAAEIARLRQVLYRQGFVGRRLVVAAPGSHLLTAVMELPPRQSGAPLEQIAAGELSRTHKCEPGAFEMSWWELPAPARAGDATHAMAAACLHRDAQALLRLFHDQGLDIACMDVASLALARLALPLLAPEEAINVVLDLGWSRSLLVLVHQRTVVYQRTLDDLGLGALHASLVRQLGVDAEVGDFLLRQVGLADEPPAGQVSAAGADGPPGPALSHEVVVDASVRQRVREVLGGHCDTIAQEIKLSLGYAAHRYPAATLGGVLAAGGGARVPGVLTRLATVLGIPVQAVDPASRPGGGPRSGSDDGCLALALGLAHNGRVAA